MPLTPLVMRRTSLLLVAAFFVQAASGAGLFARIPDVQARLGLGEAALGMVLMGMPVGSFLSFPLAAWMIERFGTKANLTIPVLAMAGAALGFALAPNAQIAFLALMITGAGFSVSNIAMNLEADRFESHFSAKIMSKAHGMWSLGFLAAATLAVGARGIGMSPALQMGINFPIVVGAMLFLHARLPAHPARNPNEARARIALPLPTRKVAAIAAFGFAGVAAHGATTNWSVLYLEQEFGTSGARAALTIPLFTLALFVARLFGDRITARYAITHVAIGCLVMTLLGVLLALFAASETIAFLGFACMGLGAALVYPLMITATAKLSDRSASENIAALTMTLSCSILIVPPIIGFMAEEFGLRAGLSVLLAALVLSFYFVRVLEVAGDDPVANA